MPTTRSTTKSQAKIDHFAHEEDADTKSSVKKRSRTSTTGPQSTSGNESATRKRKSKNSGKEEEDTPDTSTKKQKQQTISSSNDEKLEQPIIINRAPVLQLWGATVAHFLHPELSWLACLSVGNVISSLCAVSKGRAIGMIEPKDDGKSDKDPNKKANDDTERISVMGFSLPLEGDAVLMGGKPKPLSETTLKSKFGEDHYEATKQAMLDSLSSWSDDKDELDKKAFHMYEKFRPNVATGQRGWGRKGELNLHEVANIIKRLPGS